MDWALLRVGEVALAERAGFDREFDSLVIVGALLVGANNLCNILS